MKKHELQSMIQEELKIYEVKSKFYTPKVNKETYTITFANVAERKRAEAMLSGSDRFKRIGEKGIRFDQTAAFNNFIKKSGINESTQNYKKFTNKFNLGPNKWKEFRLKHKNQYNFGSDLSTPQQINIIDKKTDKHIMTYNVKDGKIYTDLDAIKVYENINETIIKKVNKNNVATIHNKTFYKIEDDLNDETLALLVVDKNISHTNSEKIAKKNFGKHTKLNPATPKDIDQGKSGYYDVFILESINELKGNWFTNLSTIKQKEYIKDHPNTDQTLSSEKKTYHFKNLKNDRTIDIKLTSTEAKDKLEQLGKDWKVLSTEGYLREVIRQEIQSVLLSEKVSDIEYFAGELIHFMKWPDVKKLSKRKAFEFLRKFGLKPEDVANVLDYVKDMLESI